MSTGARSYYDTDEIKETLTVVELIENSSVEYDPEQLERRRMACFIHGGANGTSLSIFNQDRAWFCHSCRAGGDVIELIAKLRGLTTAQAIKVAAFMAGVAAGAPPDPAVIAARAAARAVKVAAKAQADALRCDENVRAATAMWCDVLAPEWWRGTRRQACEAYLRSRGLEGVLTVGNRGQVLCAQADGSPAVPIYTFERGDSLFANGIVNIATRHVYPKPGLPKVTVLTGHTTRGTFGRSAELLFDREPHRLVLVEGVADYLAALITFSTRWRTGDQPQHGNCVVLGAHSAHGLAKIIATLGDDHEIGPRLRELPVLLVSHADGPGGAGEVAAAAVADEAGRRGIAVEHFDLEGQKDLADWRMQRRVKEGA